MITVKHLRKEYPNVTPLADVNCDIERGEVISVIGPSGTGKSTLLRCINRLEQPTSGEIWVDGENTTAPGYDIDKMRRRMGMVFQSFNLFSNYTVMENMMLAPVDLLGMSRADAGAEAMRLLRLVGLGEKADSFPDELSGGQSQRVAIARAMAMRPEMILFDEPTSALDPTMVGEVLSVIRHLSQEGLTMMIVTHEMKFARDISSRVFYMDEGVIYEDGTAAQIFDAPKRERTRNFVRRVKLLERSIASPDFDFIGFNTELELFGARQALAPSASMSALLVFEELLTANIMRHGVAYPIEFTMGVSEIDRSCELIFRYTGESFDPFLDGDELSMRIVAGKTRSHEYTYDGASGKNTLRAVL